MKSAALLALSCAGIAGCTGAPETKLGKWDDQVANIASLCPASEEVVFTCRADGGVTSVCLGAGSVSIRRNMPGEPDVVVSSDESWSNVKIFVNRSQGGLNQDRIRITEGALHYIVYWGETGSLNEWPGRRFDGVMVGFGPRGEQGAESRECKNDDSGEWRSVDSIGMQAPVGWDSDEEAGGPFDGIF